MHRPMRVLALRGAVEQWLIGVAGNFGKPAGNLSVARDQLLKKVLIYSPDRGYVAFTVPRFGEFILSRAD